MPSLFCEVRWKILRIKLYTKYPVHCKQFSEQDGGKLRYFISFKRVFTCDEKEARKAYNSERGIAILFVNTECKHWFCACVKQYWRSKYSIILIQQVSSGLPGLRVLF